MEIYIAPFFGFTTKRKHQGYRKLNLDTNEITTILSECRNSDEIITAPNIENSHEVNLLTDSYEEWFDGRNKEKLCPLLERENKKLKEFILFLSNKAKIQSITRGKDHTLWKLIFYQRSYPTMMGKKAIKIYENMYPEIALDVRNQIYEFKKRQNSESSIKEMV